METSVSSIYPEHKKLDERQQEAEVLSAFFEWLETDHVIHDHNGSYQNPKWLMYNYFGVDRDALEKERRHMLQTLREQDKT